ncbi:hypothetical protein ACJRO7_028575 [Eucalyptus globulus]|uniref:Pyrrolo-quinoline quinone repeat domain-containing protein n=1 Tax=Eucalyptus globulus TaxID=34317 RepID=A0ABD3JZY4_EUCGL
MVHHLHIQRISHGILGIFVVVAWLNHGGDLSNTRSAREEKLIGPSTVGNLRLRWKFFAGKDISATPAVANVVVYCSGELPLVECLVWKQNLSELTGLRGTTIVNVTLSRSTPTIAEKLLIVSICGLVVVIAVNRSNGRLVWPTQLDPHPRAVITTSRTAYLGAFYVGVSSTEEGLPAVQCCSFRGSLVKLNILPGAILWQTYTLPDNGGELRGYDGASIWGSSPAIDPKRRLAYAATGNHYTAPAKVRECQVRQNNQMIPPTTPNQCIGPDVNFNSIIAFEMESGRIRWASQLGAYDITDCPTRPNVDADFGHAPMLITISTNGTERDIAVVVQMRGFAWAMDHDSGDIVWLSAATDGKRVYIVIIMIIIMVNGSTNANKLRYVFSIHISLLDS